MANNDLPPSTPLDVRQGVTDAKDIAHPLRWGILGTGNISAQWVWCLQQVPGATTVAAAARDKDRAQAFADRHGIGTAYDSYADMVAAPDVDIVYVGTITRLHKEHTLLAIEAGKHVLCEKPLAVNADDAAEMYAAAKAQGVMLQDAMWTRFFPAVEHARFAIRAGVIGDVSLVQSDFFDPIYTIQAGPLGFGAEATPTRVVATGRQGGGAIVEYGEGKVAVLSDPVVVNGSLSPSRLSTPNLPKSPRSSARSGESPCSSPATARQRSPSACRPPAACHHATGHGTYPRPFSTSNTRCPATSGCPRGSRTNTGSCTRRKRCIAA
ncbi:MAG: Gfo/Idh/MocA family oxidoreductase [Gammaproteobacteria bacterium]|nr:Gfo/Idh/MocA family oxidoreductase [Gammaproteobacteria bacterium]